MDLTRLSLVDSLKASENPDAWASFVNVYGDWLAGWFVRQGLQHADIDDVRQETLAAVASSIKRFEHNGNPGAFRSWIRNIAANRLRRLWDQKSKRQRFGNQVDLGILAEQLSDDRSRASIAWDHEHRVFIIGMLLDHLANRFQAKSIAAFRRIVVEEQDAREVAKDLGMSLGAARVAQHRILKALHEASLRWTDLDHLHHTLDDR